MDEENKATEEAPINEGRYWVTERHKLAWQVVLVYDLNGVLTVNDGLLDYTLEKFKPDMVWSKEALTPPHWEIDDKVTGSSEEPA